jgi:hypothetical protein
VDMYRKVRLASAEGMSQREAARHFNISRDSVSKMMAFAVPPGYRRQAAVKRPKLDAFTGIIDAWLDGDRDVHRKQRHTAKRVYERLRDEHGFSGGYTIIKDYMRKRELRGRKMFVPLAHPPGHAQADFGEAIVIIGGVEQKAHFFVLDLPHSDGCFVRAYPAATAASGMGFIIGAGDVVTRAWTCVPSVPAPRLPRTFDGSVISARRASLAAASIEPSGKRTIRPASFAFWIAPRERPTRAA